MAVGSVTSGDDQLGLAFADIVMTEHDLLAVGGKTDGSTDIAENFLAGSAQALNTCAGVAS